ncbi:MAG: hypothetical protein E7K72_13155 [Roseomonas mucosa]|nr:hypothetical protein [Roseomonas mucosa]
MAGRLLFTAIRGYHGGMSLRLSRLVIAVLTICAFLSAGLVQNSPPAAAAPAAMGMAMDMAMMAAQGGGDSAAMPCHDAPTPPCNDKMPGCMTDLGCIFTVALPTYPVRTAERLVWDRISYWSASGLPEGISPEPFLGPPIRGV